MSFGGMEPPRFFWCAFVGMPVLFVGAVMCQFGFMGAITRYIAAENAPVAKDAFNYVGTNIQPGVKSIASAAAEGVREGLKSGTAEVD